MQIPIIIFLLLYLMMVTFFILFSIFLLYHALRFGVATKTNMLTIVIYLAVSVTFLISSYIYIVQVNWSQNLVIY
jgi:hypothetical protein